MAFNLERELFERGLRPRLCYLTKGDRGYGFHLHGERNQGAQFIRKIEPGSPADLAGLRSGDRVVEVNGENVEKDSHHQVVEKIMEVDHRTRLLVVDRATDELLRFHGLPCTEDMAVEMGCLSPRASSLTSSPIMSCSSSPRMSLSPSPGDSINLPFFRGILDKPRMPTATTEMDRLAIVVNGNKLNLCKIGNSGSGHTPTMSPVVLPGGTRGSPIPFPGLTSLPPLHLPPSPSASEAECQTDLSGPVPSVQEQMGVMRLTEVTGLTEMTRSEAAQDLRPRLCRIAVGEQGYGFNLHCDKKRAGQFVRSVDPASPAERAGLRAGDRIVEVNNRSIKGMRHSQVVGSIRGGGGQTQLLVVDPETDALFQRLGITPTAAHLKEDCVDGPLIDSPVSVCPITDSSASPSPIADGSSISLTDTSIINGSLKVHNHGSSSHSTLSEISTELSSSDTGKAFNPDHNKRHSAPGGKQEVKRTPDPLWESGLQLSPTAAEARQKARAKKANKRAPPMDWNKKHEIFSNF